MEHPLCSPDLAPYDFWLFPEIKFALKEWRFQDNGIKKDVMTTLKAVPH
jgi:hypothetical protein